jgi:single-strand DNA-binding protein
MAFLNKVMIIGRLTRDPETRQAGQSQVAGFGIAAGRSTKNKQTGQWENDPNPLFMDCEAWINAEGKGVGTVVRDWCSKGTEVYIEGRLQLDSWDDKATGQKRTKIKMVVDGLQLLGKPGEGKSQEPQQAPPPADDENGDLPF